MYSHGEVIICSLMECVHIHMCNVVCVLSVYIIISNVCAHCNLGSVLSVLCEWPNICQYYQLVIFILHVY